MIKLRQIEVGSAFVISALWIASLFLPAVKAPPFEESGWVNGSGVLAMGWIGVLMLQFGWYSNIPLVIEVYRLFKGKPIGPTYSILLGAGIAFSICWSAIVDDGGEHRITQHGSGFYAWLGAVVIGAVIPFALRMIVKRSDAGAASAHP